MAGRGAEPLGDGLHGWVFTSPLGFIKERRIGVAIGANRRALDTQMIYRVLAITTNGILHLGRVRIQPPPHAGPFEVPTGIELEGGNPPAGVWDGAVSTLVEWCSGLMPPGSDTSPGTGVGANAGQLSRDYELVHDKVPAMLAAGLNSIVARYA